MNKETWDKMNKSDRMLVVRKILELTDPNRTMSRWYFQEKQEEIVGRSWDEQDDFYRTWMSKLQ